MFDRSASALALSLLSNHRTLSRCQRLHAVALLLQPARDRHPVLQASSVDALTDQHWYQTQHLDQSGSATSLGSNSNSSLEDKMQTLLRSGHYQVTYG